MELVMERFFPCTQADARKIFPMINRHCSMEQRAFLKDFLEDMALGFLLDEKDTLHKRALMNVRYLVKGGGFDEVQPA